MIQRKPDLSDMGAPADVRLSIHDDLPAVESEWRAFELHADCTVFQSFGWLSSWQRHIGAGKGVRPAIVIGRDARGEILFLLPLSVEPRGFARRLVWLASQISDYNAPLLAPEFSQRLAPRPFLSLWPEILRRIQGHRELRFDLIHFVRMPETVGAQQNPFRHLPVILHPSGAYLAHLAGDWETFYATRRSPSTRQRDRTKRKRLGELGEVKLVTPTAAGEMARTFDALMAQKTRAFASMGVGNLFDRPGHADFYRALAIDPATRPIAHLSRLDVGPIAAAINLGLTFRGRYYHVLASYDDGEASRFGAGAAHLHDLMRHAIETGCEIFDFTVGDEPYKRDWSDTESALFDHVRPARWRGVFAALALLGLIRVKRFIKQTPGVWKAFSKARAFIGTLRGRATAGR
jgi:CelD/BcsL family acetyltransferase involved in cellulose biosynthesis